MIPAIVINEKETKAEETLSEFDVLDTSYIGDLEEALSNVTFIFDRARCFGTNGEAYTANSIIKPNMTALGSHLKNIHLEKIEGTYLGNKLDEKRIIQDWYLNITATKTGHQPDYRNLTTKCFPFITHHKSNTTWGPYTKTVLNATGSSIGENESERPELYMWLTDVGEENPYDWISDWVGVTTKFFMAMDSHPDTWFMTQLKPVFAPFGFNKPGFSITCDDGNWIKDKIDTGWDVEATFYQNHTYKTVDSYNVIGEIYADGAGNESVVVVGAHYDSWWGQCAIDNAAGASIMLGITKYFVDNEIQPKYRVKFVAFGGEEWPPYSCGSKHYAKINHSDETNPIMINLDQLAHKTNDSILFIYSDDSNEAIMINNTIIRDLIDYPNRTGYSLGWKEGPGAGDGEPFDDLLSAPDVVSFFKEMPTNDYFPEYQRDGENHTKGDVLDILDKNDLNITAQAALATVLHYTVDDTTKPVSTIDSLAYWHRVSSLLVTTSPLDDLSGTLKTKLEYKYRETNSSAWGGWKSYGDTLYWDPWEWEFIFPNGTGFYRLRTIATDYVGNEETKSSSTYDVEIGYDTGDPEIVDNQAGDNTWHNNENYDEIYYDVDFSDALSGLDKIWVRDSDPNTWRLLIDLGGEESYTTDWNLPSQVWNDLEQGQNNIDVRADDLAGNQKIGYYPFYVKKDVTDPGDWNNFSPLDWISDQTPDCSIDVRDTYYSGLDVDTAYYTFSTDGGNSWFGWESTTCTGTDGSTTFETITAEDVPFNQDSETLNKIKFRISDIAGNIGFSPPYTVKIDADPPEISNVKAKPFAQKPDQFVNITCTINDSSSGIDEVHVIITYPNSSQENATMSNSVDDTYYHNNNYSIIGNYSYYIWAKDNIGNQNTSGIFNFMISEYSIALYDNWNLITVPVENDWTGESLGQNVTGCTVVTMFDGSTQTFISHVVGVPHDDFPIENGTGYFIWVNNSSAFVMEGSPIEYVDVPIYTGWNLIGWYKNNDTFAETLGQNITNCTVVIMMDAKTQDYTTHVVGVPHDNFLIEWGHGYFVYTSSESTWYGEPNETGGKGEGEGKSGEGGGSKDGGAGDPHPVYGYVYVKGEEPVAGANVTLINNRTQDESYDETEEDGYYGIDLGNMGWQDGDNLTILVNGTGEFEGWTGTAYITVDEDLVPQKVEDINLIEP